MGKKLGNNLRFVVCILILVMFSLNFVSSAHYIAGYVDDAKDGESSNNKIVTLWNPVIGEGDNLTEIVGVNGDGGSPNVYLFDCELLQNGCKIGDEMRVKVIDSGDGYVSNYSSVLVTSAGFDMLDNVSLNTPPVAGIISPLDNFITNKQKVNITCSFNDLDNGVGELSLYSNHGGSWELFQTKPQSSGSAVFELTYTSGTYKYACYADDYFNSDFSENRTIIIDLMDPIVNFLNFNESNFCGTKALKVTCDTFDDVALKEVVVLVDGPITNVNLTASHESGDLYSVVLPVNEVGNWDFQCRSEDNATNLEYGNVSSIYSYSGNSDLLVNSGDINFSKIWPAERENITVSLNITNKGCSDANNFLVSFYEGNPQGSGVQFGNNLTTSVSKFSSKVVNILFETTIGLKNIFALVDLENSVLEDSEDNNLANNSFSVPSWQEFYGNISSVKVLLSGASQLGNWDNDSTVEGNVFMADSESQIDWMSLRALGRKKSGGYSSNDFSEVDSLLSMEGYFDSVSNEYSSFVGSNFIINQNNVSAVPTIQSTDNNNFVTGILWDSSDDSNGEFDSTEKEDLVFVSKVNSGALGKYGHYDYELRVPAKLREYYKTNTEDIYFYYELV